MLKHDQAFSAFELKKKYVCDNKMYGFTRDVKKYSIPRDGILVLYCSKYVSLILIMISCSDNTQARRICFEMKTTIITGKR